MFNVRRCQKGALALLMALIMSVSTMGTAYAAPSESEQQESTTSTQRSSSTTAPTTTKEEGSESTQEPSVASTETSEEHPQETTEQPKTTSEEPSSSQSKPSSREQPAPNDGKCSKGTNGRPAKEKWSPTKSPKSRVVRGQMRSDCEQIPGGFTKADADKAETMEAQLATQTLNRSAVAAGCQVYWPAPYEVCGAIRDKYNQLGGPNSFLLFPKSNELTNPGGTGKRSEFVGGNIYWSAATGARPVAHDFLTKWGSLGYERSFLGYPTTDEIVLEGGRRQEFKNGTIYWSPTTGAQSITGLIREKYLASRAEVGVLGYPTSDEKKTADGVGRYNTFQFGRLYWSPTTGAHPVYGPTLRTWGEAGYESGHYGYPIEDTVGDQQGGDHQKFQHGTIDSPAPVLGNPPWRPADDKEPGPNYDDMQECLGGYDTGWLTHFPQHGGVDLYCQDLRYIKKHLPAVVNETDWDDFQTCIAFTLASTETFEPNKEDTFGMTRYNTYTNVRSHVIVRYNDVSHENRQTIFNAYTDGDGGRDWGGCRKYLL